MAFFKEPDVRRNDPLPPHRQNDEVRKRVQLLNFLDNCLTRFGVERYRKFGPFTVDLIKELEREMKDVSDEEILAGIDYLIREAPRVREAFA